MTKVSNENLPALRFCERNGADFCGMSVWPSAMLGMPATCLLWKKPHKIQSLWSESTRRGRSRRFSSASALDHIDFNRLDFDTQLLKPMNGGFDLRPLAVEFKTDDADFIGDARLTDVSYDVKLMAQLPDQRLLD